MKLLILGGTAFVGRHLVEAALHRGHAVTLFNRGKRNPGLFPEVTHAVGDRDGGLGALEGGTWDAVIDTSGYFPRLVKASAEALRERVGLYAFISTVSVYADPAPGMDEGAPLATLKDPSVETKDGETYGGLKVLCEQAVTEIYADRALIVRPGIIAGPHDPTDRFTYWAKRMAQGGEVWAPGPADAPVQVIDARDLAAWLLRMVEAGGHGTYNAAGPRAPLTRADFLAALKPQDGSAAVSWLDAAELKQAGLDPEAAFPFYTNPEDAGFFAVSTARAQAAGLMVRPLAETAHDTLSWLAGEPERPLKYGAAVDKSMRRAGGKA